MSIADKSDAVPEKALKRKDTKTKTEKSKKKTPPTRKTPKQKKHQPKRTAGPHTQTPNPHKEQKTPSLGIRDGKMVPRNTEDRAEPKKVIT